MWRGGLYHGNTSGMNTLTAWEEFVPMFSVGEKDVRGGGIPVGDTYNKKIVCVKGAAMGSPLSPVVANLFMEDFEIRALNPSPNPQGIWLRFVDNTFVIHRAEQTQQFLTHLNSLDPNMLFTTKSPDQQGFIPFLDTLTSQGPNSTLITTVYRKPTHTDQYLHWESHHSITNK